jgi:hypothetical protein
MTLRFSFFEFSKEKEDDPKKNSQDHLSFFLGNKKKNESKNWEK